MKIKNKKARFAYEILETEVAGIVLKGTEIKSISVGKVSFTDTYCLIINNEMWVKNLHISEYEHGTHNNHDPKRDKKLLLTKRQISYFNSKINEKGLTLIPLDIFINENGFAKLTISLSKGKKTQDKRQTIKEKDIKKDMNREIKNLKF